MKKLMIAAAAAAMIGGAQAATAADVATVGYVYNVNMEIMTTQATLCDKVIDRECGESDGGDVLIRVEDNYVLEGFIYGCAKNCTHLESFLQALPAAYSKGSKSSYGVLLWDIAHEIPFIPVNTNKYVIDNVGQAKVATYDARDWKGQDKDFVLPMMNCEFLNNICANFDRSEMAFDFNADALYPIVGNRQDGSRSVVANRFNMKAAGWGVIDTGYWVTTAGYMAGTMSAPHNLNSQLEAFTNGRATLAEAYGRLCTQPLCGGQTMQVANRSNTFAYGQWVISYNESASRAYGSSYAVALTWAPTWVLW